MPSSSTICPPTMIARSGSGSCAMPSVQMSAARGARDVRRPTSEGKEPFHSLPAWVQHLRPERCVVPVAQRDGHAFGHAIDGDVAEELQVEGGRQVLTLLLGGRLQVHQLRAESAVEIIGAE